MPNTYALGYDCVEEFLADVHTCGMDNIEFDYEHAKRLLVGAVIVSEIRAAVYEETGNYLFLFIDLLIHTKIPETLYSIDRKHKY